MDTTARPKETVSPYLLAGFVLGFVGVYLWQELRYEEQRLALIEAQGDAAFARETAQKLLSKGRFVRSYDERTGYSTYRFAKQKEQR